MPRYRFLPFRNEHDTNPLSMLTGNCTDFLEARTRAKNAAEEAGAEFVAIVNDQGDITERWRFVDGDWRPFDA